MSPVDSIAVATAWGALPAFGIVVGALKEGGRSYKGVKYVKGSSIKRVDLTF